MYRYFMIFNMLSPHSVSCSCSCSCSALCQGVLCTLRKSLTTPTPAPRAMGYSRVVWVPLGKARISRNLARSLHPESKVRTSTFELESQLKPKRTELLGTLGWDPGVCPSSLICLGDLGQKAPMSPEKQLPFHSSWTRGGRSSRTGLLSSQKQYTVTYWVELLLLILRISPTLGRGFYRRVGTRAWESWGPSAHSIMCDPWSWGQLLSFPF